MNKSLEQLAAEYDESVAMLKNLIPDIRQERKQAIADGNADKAKKLSEKLLIMYEEIRDMQIISENLKHYYDNSSSEKSLTEAS